jgi:hypothetical protein
VRSSGTPANRKRRDMRRATIDTTQAMSFEATAPGPYLMKVDEIEDPKPSAGETKAVGTIIYFAFEDPNLARQCGRARRWYALEGKGAGFFREFWKAATGEDIPLNEKLDVDLDDAVGRSVMVNIGNETYEGRLQNSVERVAAAS